MYTVKINNLEYEVIKKQAIIEAGKVVNIGTVKLRSIFGVLKVATTPEAATINVVPLSNMENLYEKSGKTPFYQKLLHGKYKVKVSKENYVTAEKEVTIDPGSLVEEQIKLNRKRVEVIIRSSPSEAKIFINKDYKGNTPLHINLEVRTYRLTLSKGEMGCMSDIEVSEQTHEITRSLHKDKPPMEYFVEISEGSFFMGSQEIPEEGPIHKVYLDNYWTGKYEVTVTEYKRCVDAGICNIPINDQELYCNWAKEGYENHPINCVSWEDATDYTKWYSQEKGLKFRLPTEAEWEKAARGDNSFKYPWGDVWDDNQRANICDKNCPVDEWKEVSINDGYPTTAPVDKFDGGKSQYGIYNMTGNVKEWCMDYYGANFYSKPSQKNPRNKNDNNLKVLRGGSWDIYPKRAYTTSRSNLSKDKRKDYVGFRMVFPSKNNLIKCIN